jgi:hypothetical protein
VLPVLIATLVVVTSRSSPYSSCRPHRVYCVILTVLIVSSSLRYVFVVSSAPRLSCCPHRAHCVVLAVLVVLCTSRLSRCRCHIRTCCSFSSARKCHLHYLYHVILVVPCRARAHSIVVLSLLHRPFFVDVAVPLSEEAARVGVCWGR